MVLTKESSNLAHLQQNISLLVLSICLLPLSTCILIFSFILRPWLAPKQSMDSLLKIRKGSPFRPKTILVTGVGMTKGLCLARLFHAAGHRVIGADFENPSRGVIVCGHVSRSVHRFYALRKPDAKSSDRYVEDLLHLVQNEHVDMWVSCSGVASAVSDGEAKETIEQATKCRCIQFDVKTTETLHEKNTFIAHTRSLGLTVPETHEVTSREQVRDFLTAVKDQRSNKRYILKTVGMDDANRADMTLLPRPTVAETETVLKRVNASPSNPWIIQQFINGSEFCTHSLVIRGQVKAFVACPSAELLMHYEALSPDSALSRAMLAFTEKYATAGGEGFTGHLSFDFLVEQRDLSALDPANITLYPIECNPRAHTAVALFNSTPALVDAYLSLLSPTGASKRQEGLVTPINPAKYYWIGHDLISCVVVPITECLRGVISGGDIMDGVREFMDHVLHWKDGTYEVWDPLPWWWLYHVYWPAKFAEAVLTGARWSRINVSTTKMFAC